MACNKSGGDDESGGDEIALLKSAVPSHFGGWGFAPPPQEDF